MNVAHIEINSYIYGPGCRFVIWVQGCSLRCKGCWNSEMWSFDSREEFSIAELLKMVSMASVEGITILGGEPLDQFDEVFILCKKCQAKGFSTMVFTGYEIAEIENSNKSAIKSVADILITGRYMESRRTTSHQWIGSTNQQILFLTERYKGYKIEDSNYVEIDIKKLAINFSGRHFYNFSIIIIFNLSNNFLSSSVVAVSYMK